MNFILFKRPFLVVCLIGYLLVAAIPALSSTGTFSISASPLSISVAQGNLGTSTLTTAISGGFNNSISLSASGLPGGASASFSPPSIASPGAGSSRMTVSVGSNTAPGTYSITVTGSGGGIQMTSKVTLTVTAQPNFSLSSSPASLSVAQGNYAMPTITTAVSGGFNSAVSLSASGVPTGTNVIFYPQTIAAPGAGSSTLYIFVGSNTPLGTYPITLTGSGGGIQRSTTVTLTVISAGNFTLSASPTSLTVAQGNQGTSTITTTVSGGFNSSITLLTSDPPSGTTVSLNVNPIPAPGSGTSTITFSVGTSTPAGTYPLTVTATGGGVQQAVTITLTVTAPPNFNLSAAPISLNVLQGNLCSSTITATVSGGFNSSIALSASGVPAGTTVTFNPQTLAAPGAGSSTIAFNVGSNTSLGTYLITVTGNGGGIQQSATLSLTVSAQAQPNFTISASPLLLAILPGKQATSTITTAITGVFNSSIAVSASGIPSGTTVSFNPQSIPAPGNGSSTMTITVGGSTPLGTYPITLTGNGGGIQKNTTVTLTVVAQQTPPNAIIGYGFNSSNIPPALQPAFAAWVFANFQLSVETGNIDLSSDRSSANAWTTYVDGCCIYGKDIYQSVLSTAATQGWSDPEGSLLHMNIDYQPSPAYSGIEEFDAYEQKPSQSAGVPALAINGIFTLVGSTYTDVTVQSYCPTAGIPTDYGSVCANYAPSPVTVYDRMLIGYQVPFDTVNVNLKIARSGGAVTWQYWNGSSFSNLTLSTDTTNGLTASGKVTFPPPSNWVPSIVNGSQSKYWVQITVSGAGTNPSLSKVYGDNLLSACSYGQCARGWNPTACVSGHINVGTPVEYCATPASGSTARFRQQARALGYVGSYNRFLGNMINTQNSQNTWAYVEQARTAAGLRYSGMNGVMFDNVGCSPTIAHPTWSTTQTELGSTSYFSAATTMFQIEHTLLTSTYGSNPRWWDGMNSCYFDSAHAGLYTSMNWMMSEIYNRTTNSMSMDTISPSYLCTNSLWCVGQTGSNNPNSTVEYRQIRDYAQFGLQDGNGSTLSNYHLWDMSQRGPINALAMYYMIQNPSVLFGYDPAGAYYDGFDDYYYWVMSAQTVSAPGIPASTCNPGPCTIPLSAALETSTCPGGETMGCPIRIGGVDVVGTTSYSGSTLTTQNTNGPDAILHSYPVGASIEYAVRGHQSQDIQLHTPVAMYGFFVPASAIYLGTPDSTYGFNTPCSSSTYYIDGGCIWKHGPAISGNSAACTSGGIGNGFPLEHWCSPLLRRDFTGGTYGNAIVLLRPVTYQNSPTASTEYDTYSQTITLPGTYYQVMANGTVSSTPITTTTLRGGEAGIYVTGQP